MIRATKVVIDRAEGPTQMCVQRTFEGAGCISGATSWLHTQSHTFPEHGGYDKHDFQITFEDGEIYEGRLDCKRHTCQDNDLDVADHVRNHVTYLAGLHCPAHMTAEQYAAAVKRHGQEAEAKRWLETYALE